MAATPGNEGQLLAAGLYQLLHPIVEECDARIQEVMDSQANLSSQIETLATDLDFFMTFTQTPPLAAHLQRLLNARNRLVTINTTLLTIMNRLDRIAVGVDPQSRERKSSIGSLFKGLTKDSPKKDIPTQPLTEPPSTPKQPPPQPQFLQTPTQTQPQEQPTQENTNSDEKSNENTETTSNESKTEQTTS